MGLLFPYFLIGLAALSVPVIIHLWSKNTRKSIDFGSIRFLRESETKTIRSVMPSQWLLLLLRMIVLSLLVILLTSPFFEQKLDVVETVYLVDNKYADHPWIQSLNDSLRENDKAFWLSKDFPSIDQEVPNELSDYWQLLAKLPLINAKKTVVISPLLVKDFNGKKRTFPVKYEWIKLPVDPLTKSTLSYQKGEYAFQVNTTFDEWASSHSILEKGQAKPLEVTYLLKADETFKSYESMFETAAQTLNDLSPLTMRKVGEIEEADWVFWFSKEEIPPQSRVIAIESAQVRKWSQVRPSLVLISSDWKLKDAVKQALPKKLMMLMSPRISDVNDQKTMDVRSFSYEEAEQIGLIYARQDASSFIWILFLLGLIGERWMSYKTDRR